MKIQLDMGPVEMDLQVRLRDAARERALTRKLHDKDKRWDTLLGVVATAATAAIPLALTWFQQKEDQDLPQGSGCPGSQECDFCGEVIGNSESHPRCSAAYGRGVDDAAKAHRQGRGEEDGEPA